MRLPTTRRRRRRSGLLAIGLLVGLTALAVGAGDAPPAPAATDDFTEPVFSADARGDILTIGNAQLTCDTTATFPGGGSMADACDAARTGGQPRTPSGAPYGVSNNDYVMVAADVDADASTFSSTTSDLQVPEGAAVLWAGLHWFGTHEVTTSDTPPVLPPDADAWETVRFGPPGAGYRSLVAEDSWYSDATTDVFAGFVDVTDLVAEAGSGTYRVADIQSYTGGGGGGYAAGWSLTVAFAHPDEPMRNLTVWHGLEPVHPAFGPLDLALGGFTPPPAGAVDARLGVVAFEGDRDRTTKDPAGDPCWSDSVVLASDTRTDGEVLTTPTRPWPTPIVDPSSGECTRPGARRDFFDSTISDDIAGHPPITSNPSHPTNMATDIALVDSSSVITNDSREVRVAVTSHCGCEQVNVQVVHLAIELYPPEVAVRKDVAPAETGDEVRAGDEVVWTVTATNDTDFDLYQARLVDPLPPGVTYVPGSLEVVAGPEALLGPKTDAAGDDEAEYDPATRTVTARVGAGADATEGGLMTAPARATDGSERAVLTFRTTIDADAAGTTVTNEVRATGEAQQLDDPFPAIVSEDADDAEVAVAPPDPDLVVRKSTEDQPFRAGTENTYTLTVENRGEGTEPAPVVTDVLREGLELVTATDGGTYDEASRTVTWLLDELGPGASTSVDLTVVVATPVADGLVDEQGTVPNTVRLAGTRDCVPDVSVDEDCEATVENPTGAPHLAQDKVVDRAEAEPGDELTYTITVTNDGDAPAVDVVAVDALPAEVDLVDATPEPGEVEVADDGAELRWTIGDLAAGATATLTVRATVGQGEWDVAFVNRVETGHGTECVGACPPTTVGHPCDDDPAASCAPTRTPERTAPPPTEPAPPTTDRGAPAGPAAPTASPAPRAASGPLARTGVPIAVGVLVALVVAATGTALVASSRPLRRR